MERPTTTSARSWPCWTDLRGVRPLFAGRRAAATRRRSARQPGRRDSQFPRHGALQDRPLDGLCRHRPSPPCPPERLPTARSAHRRRTRRGRLDDEVLVVRVEQAGTASRPPRGQADLVEPVDRIPHRVLVGLDQPGDHRDPVTSRLQAIGSGVAARPTAPTADTASHAVTAPGSPSPSGPRPYNKVEGPHLDTAHRVGVRPFGTWDRLGLGATGRK